MVTDIFLITTLDIRHRGYQYQKTTNRKYNKITQIEIATCTLYSCSNWGL